MIKSLLYYIALLLFVIYNCNTPLNSIKSFIPVSIGKYLLSFPAFIIVTTILVVYPILTGKELFTFDVDSLNTNIFSLDDANSVNKSAIVIDDSGEIILEKSSDVNKSFSDLITSLKADLARLNSKINNNSNILKTQTENFVNKTNQSLNDINTQFAGSATAYSAITPRRISGGNVECISDSGNPREVQKQDSKMCKRIFHTSDTWKNSFIENHHEIRHCVGFHGAAWLTFSKTNAGSGQYACIPFSMDNNDPPRRVPSTIFESALQRGRASVDDVSLNFTGLQVD